MLLFSKIFKSGRSFLIILSLLLLSACQFQPLHGDNSTRQGGGLDQVRVASVDNRVAQQVRNHLVFLLGGGFSNTEKTHEVKLRISFNNKLLGTIPEEEDDTTGIVTVQASYDLIDLATGETVASGRRDATASYERTGQVFSNNRATRDAENRAAKQAAESLRLAVASDISKL